MAEALSQDVPQLSGDEPLRKKVLDLEALDTALLMFDPD